MQFGPNAQRFIEHDLFQKSATRLVKSIGRESLEALLLLQTTYELDIAKLIHGAFESTNKRYEVPPIPMENKESLILEDVLTLSTMARDKKMFHSGGMNKYLNYIKRNRLKDTL